MAINLFGIIITVRGLINTRYILGMPLPRLQYYQLKDPSLLLRPKFIPLEENELVISKVIIYSVFIGTRYHYTSDSIIFYMEVICIKGVLHHVSLHNDIRLYLHNSG